MESASVAIGDTFYVSAHPYLRWTVVAIEGEPRTDAVPNVVLRSTADPAVRRTIALPVLQNRARFQRA